MRLFATELLSPPWMASELLWPVWCCHATGVPGPHLSGCPMVAAMANPRAEGDKLLEDAGPAPASAVATPRSPSMVPRHWGDRCVPMLFSRRDLEAKLTPPMAIQNLEGEIRPQHCGPCPPSCPVPQFPQRNSIFLGCPPWSSAKGLGSCCTSLTMGCISTGHRGCQQTDPGRGVHYPPSHPPPPAWAAQCVPTITLNTKHFRAKADAAAPPGWAFLRAWLRVVGSAARRRGCGRAARVPAV